ncbi:MAG: ankyrin repeat domain-containing protein [Acidobacteriota bacterium]
MVTSRFVGGLLAVLLGLTLVAQASNATVADAAMAGDVDAVRALLKDGADVNAAQGDGMTALHWAATQGHTELARMLLVAGANVRALTRLGGYTPLHLAAKAGHAGVVAALLAAGADPNAASSVGSTPLMLGAASGDVRTTTILIENRADVNAAERSMGLTPLMYAAANNRLDVVRALLKAGATPTATTKVTNLRALTAPEEEQSRQRQGAQEDRRTPGLERPFRYNELIGTQGGMAPLHFAARHGYAEVVAALLAGGAALDQPNPGDQATPLLVAIINGHFDLALDLLARGANPNAMADNGVTPLYATLNLQWAPKALYPQPRAYLQQQATYLDLLEALLEKGADPNVRVKRKVWYSGYNFDLSGVDEIGATPFWRAAYAADVDAMKLLVSHGADPHIPTFKPVGRPRTGDADTRELRDVSGLPPVPVGGPGVPPLLAAAGVGYGEGFAANAHRFAPGGMLAAVRYLVEELHADVNAVDHEGSTALHHAAARGDNETIAYLVSKGADPHKVNREGQNVADMANGPVQRIEPFPETLKLLETFGVKHQGKCISC